MSAMTPPPSVVCPLSNCDQAAIAPGAVREIEWSRTPRLPSQTSAILTIIAPNSLQIGTGDAGARQVGCLNIGAAKVCRRTRRSPGVAGVLLCRQVRWSPMSRQLSRASVADRERTASAQRVGRDW